MFSNNDKNQPETWNSDSHWKHRCQHWETKDSNKMRNCSSGQYQCLFPDWELPSVILSTSQPKSTEKKNQCYFLSPRNVTATALHCYHGLCDRKKSKQGSSLHDIKILDVNTHSYEKKGEFW